MFLIQHRVVSPAAEKINKRIIAKALIDGGLILTSRLVFSDGERWRLRLLLLPELRRSGCDTRSRALTRARSPHPKFEVALAVAADRGRTRGRLVS